VLACGARKTLQCADGARAITFRVCTIFAALLSSWRCERAPWVVGSAGMQARIAAIVLAPKQVCVSIDVVHA